MGVKGDLFQKNSLPLPQISRRAVEIWNQVCYNPLRFIIKDRNMLMKILVLSDSHSGLSFMRECVKKVRPDAIIHLGDYFDDGETIAQENPCIPMYQVPGNCDRYRSAAFGQPEILIQRVLGVELYMTHGHKHNVKLTLGPLLLAARKSKAAAVLYGHTHIADCFREPDGLWVLNPGSCGSWGGSAGLMEVERGSIIDCRILRLEDLEEML